MKRAYYIFSLENKIKACGECPMLDKSGLGFWCQLLNTKISDHKKICLNCPLVYVEGKVSQN